MEKLRELEMISFLTEYVGYGSNSKSEKAHKKLTDGEHNKIQGELLRHKEDITEVLNHALEEADTDIKEISYKWSLDVEFEEVHERSD